MMKQLSQRDTMTEEINTEHVMESACKHLVNSINRSQAHISNLLLKTDDKDGWQELHAYFTELQRKIEETTDKYLDSDG